MAVSGRPINELPATITGMGEAALRAETATVRRMTDVCGDIVDRHGFPYRIRSGNNGRKYPLESKRDVRRYATQAGVVLVRGAVRGIPEGFWQIVVNGSFPHIIAARKDRQGKGRTTRSGREVSRKLTFGQQTRRLQRGEGLGVLAPIRTPYGPRQYVMHPGHGQIADPWSGAMGESEDRLPQVMEIETTRRFLEQFTTAGGKRKSFMGGK